MAGRFVAGRLCLRGSRNRNHKGLIWGFVVQNCMFCPRTRNPNLSVELKREKSGDFSVLVAHTKIFQETIEAKNHNRL